MLRHYLTMAVRSLARQKLYSFINIAGLTLGLASVIFIFLFIRYEVSFDKWVPHTARLYRMELTANLPGRGLYRTALTPAPWAKAMQEGIPGVLAATRLRTRRLSLWVGNRSFVETVDVVDPDFFQVIPIPLLAGDAAHVLDQPESVVLSQDTARKLFGNTSPVGQTVAVRWMQCAGTDVDCKEASFALTVTGVMRNVPQNSQLAASVIVPSNSILGWSQHDEREWLSANYYSYVELAPGVGPQSVIAAFQPIMDRGSGPVVTKLHLRGPASRFVKVHLTPFVNVHLASSRYHQNMTPPGSWITVYGVALIGMLILLVACFNFMNLTTARASLRAQEIALRKCVGASRKQLVTQLLGESVAMALCSLVLALALVEMLLPAFDAFLHRAIAFHFLGDWRTSLMILTIAVGAGVVSGSYPALVLSRFRPGTMLRAGAAGQAGSGRLRTLLVVLQFAVSIGLGIGAIVVSRQINFARRMDLGFDPHRIVVMRTGNAPSTPSFIEALRKYPGVVSVALSSHVPFSSAHPLWLVKLPGQPGLITVRKMMVAPSFPNVYGIPLLAGRFLSMDRSDDTLTNGISPRNAGHNILINVTAANRFGYTPARAIGKMIVLNNSPVRIVGVLGNIKYFGALERVQPTVFFNDPGHMSTLSIRIRGRNVPATLAFIDRTWRSFAPLYSPQGYFLSARYATYYQAYQRQGVMLEIFVAVAIVIASLGLFGLTVFTAERRTKEIGIRKISGARTRDIVRLMLWQISVPVIVANLIAWPTAHYYLSRWLEGYAYRIALSPVYFLAGALTALGIAWMTVLAHALRLARTSPVQALHYE